jgi:hypothetical protein
MWKLIVSYDIKKWFNETLNLKPYQPTTKELKLHYGSISNTKPNQLSIKE